MSDPRTMRTFLDLVAERDEALGEATRLADLYALAVSVLDTVLSALTDAPGTPESGPLAAERPDPFHGHHPEHSTPQEGTQ